MSLDRPDLCVVANRLSRFMASPRVGDETLVRRVCRCLRSTCPSSLFCPFQSPQSKLFVETDSDWAGCRLTRRSTSGVVVRIGAHPLFFSCRLQKSIALSSGEAEMVAQVGGISEGLGICNLYRELGIQLDIISRCDSSVHEAF